MQRASSGQQRRNGASAAWRAGLHLLVALALAFAAVAPPQVVVGRGFAGEAALPVDANGFTICHALPPDDGPAVPIDDIGHCKACILVGHALAVATAAPAAPLPAARPGARLLPAPVVAPLPAANRESSPARAPPVLA